MAITKRFASENYVDNKSTMLVTLLPAEATEASDDGTTTYGRLPNYTVDKPFAEIMSHVNNGGNVVLYDSVGCCMNMYMNLIYSDSDEAVLMFNCIYVKSNDVNVLAGIVNPIGAIQYTVMIQDGFVFVQEVVVDLNSTEIDLLNTTDKTIPGAINEVLDMTSNAGGGSSDFTLFSTTTLSEPVLTATLDLPESFSELEIQIATASGSEFYVDSEGNGVSGSMVANFGTDGTHSNYSHLIYNKTINAGSKWTGIWAHVKKISSTDYVSFNGLHFMGGNGGAGLDACHSQRNRTPDYTKLSFGTMSNNTYYNTGMTIKIYYK